MLLCKVKIIT